MLIYIAFIVLSLSFVAAKGTQNDISQGSTFGTTLLHASEDKLQSKLVGSPNPSEYEREIQRRNLKLYPEWFSQRIKKLVAKRFAHNGGIAQDHRKTTKGEIPTPKFRRSSLYGIGDHRPVIIADDVADSSVASQSLNNLPAGSELVDLPPNYQALSPDAFHDLSYSHGK